MRGKRGYQFSRHFPVSRGPWLVQHVLVQAHAQLDYCRPRVSVSSPFDGPPWHGALIWPCCRGSCPGASGRSGFGPGHVRQLGKEIALACGWLYFRTAGHPDTLERVGYASTGKPGNVRDPSAARNARNGYATGRLCRADHISIMICPKLNRQGGWQRFLVTSENQ